MVGLLSLDFNYYSTQDFTLLVLHSMNTVKVNRPIDGDKVAGAFVFPPALRLACPRGHLQRIMPL